ncbi:anti-sigma B factor RsbW [Paenibacillus sp. CMAA1364]
MSSEIQKVVITLPAKAEFVDIVRLNLYGISSNMGFSYEEIEDMKVAVSEACNNAVLHAYRQQEGTVEVTFEINRDNLTITVKDHGESFENVDVKSEDKTLHHKELDEIEIGGLGFYLMQALMDDVNVESHAGKGTEVTLSKRIMRSEEAV